MVKFSKQLEGQLVPEWRPAYVNYKILKKELKQLSRQQPRRSISDGVSYSIKSAMTFAWNDRENATGPQCAASSSTVTPAPERQGGPPLRHKSLAKEGLESLVSLGGQAANALRSKSQRRTRTSHNHQVIEVRKLDEDPCEHYETTLLEPINRLEPAKLFFARLDTQFNKVNQFFRTKEREFIDQAQILEKQMQALVDMRKALEESQLQENVHTSTSRDQSGSSKQQNLTNFDKFDLALTRLQSLEVGELDLDLERGGELHLTRPTTAVDEELGQTCGTANAAVECESSARSPEGSVAAGLPACEVEIGSRPKCTTGSTPQMIMRMRIATPSTTLSALSHTLWEDLLKKSSRTENQTESQISVSKKKINMAEKMLRNAFVEYYRGLNLLKSYCSLNMVAFAKILKKFDKVSGQKASAIFLKAVETSYFNTSGKIIKLLEKVETLYTNYFAKYNRHKAMLSLRPRPKKSSHTVTFILGVFVGGSLALLAVYSILLRIMLPEYHTPAENDNLAPGEVPHSVYVKTIFPIFSMIMLILIHIYMYGANLYFWRRLRINYAFIFEFAPGTELRHREVLMIASVLTTLLVGAMVGHLALHSVATSPYVDFIPLGLIMLMVVTLFFPLNIIYRSSRVFFLNAVLHIIGSPLYKVVLADFFLADQLTSQVPMLRNMQYVICYYFGGFFRTGNADACLGNEEYKGLTYLISLLPYWWRLTQCARRYVDEADRAHIANGGKYLSALIAVALRIQYGRNSSAAWATLFVLASIVATIYQVYWDLVVDWGLLRKESSNKWLRDQLIMPKMKYIYFLSMVTNVLLRLAWLQSVTRFRFGTLDYQVNDFIFASLEVIRRGHWNFYRLENEHLNNVGKYRATKTVPLPFEDPTNEDD